MTFHNWQHDGHTVNYVVSWPPPGVAATHASLPGLCIIAHAHAPPRPSSPGAPPPQTAGCGPPVLLVHGFGASVGHYRKLIPALAQTHKVRLPP